MAARTTILRANNLVKGVNPSLSPQLDRLALQTWYPVYHRKKRRPVAGKKLCLVSTESKDIGSPKRILHMAPYQENTICKYKYLEPVLSLLVSRKRYQQHKTFISFVSCDRLHSIAHMYIYVYLIPGMTILLENMSGKHYASLRC